MALVLDSCASIPVRPSAASTAAARLSNSLRAAAFTLALRSRTVREKRPDALQAPRARDTVSEGWAIIRPLSFPRQLM